MDNKINWKSTNVLGNFDDRWNLTNCTITDNNLVMVSGGVARITITEGMQKVFQYLRVENEFQGSGFSQSMNYNSNPRINIGCIYEDSGGKVTDNKFHSLGFNIFTPTGTDEYKDETILSTLNKRIKSMVVIIRNTTGFTVTIKGLRIYQSLEVTGDQVVDAVDDLGQIVQDTVYDSMERMATSNITVYENDTGEINGLELAITGSEIPAKLKFQKIAGKVTNIITNFSEPIGIDTIVGDLVIEE